MARLSAQRKQLTEEGREAGRSLMKREKSTEPRMDLCGTPRRIGSRSLCSLSSTLQQTKHTIKFLST